MACYDVFADFYDSLTGNVDYDSRAEYILSLFAHFGSKPGLMLDLACGTGSITVRLAEKGIEMIGVDRSEDMLIKARQKAEQAGLSVLFLCQDAKQLDLYGTVDSAICTLDSINHITDQSELLEVMRKVSLFLEPGCLFIFDVNTEYKHKYVLADNTFVYETDDVFCTWQNAYDDATKTVDIALDFFVFNGESYDRCGEDFSERVYSDDELAMLAEKSGMKIIAIYDDMTFSSPHKESERKIFVMRKL